MTRKELLATGITPREIKQRLNDGRLYRVFHGVYAVGHDELTPLARAHAATLAIPNGVLSPRNGRRPVGDGRRLAGRAARNGGAPRRPRAEGHHLHRVRALDRAHKTKRRDLPVTTPARTLLDLAETLDPTTLRRAIRQAEFDRLVSHEQLTHLLDAHPGRRGRARFTDTTDTPTRSEFEDRFLTLMDQAGLPRPEPNAPLHGARVDFLWPEQRVIVETDGWNAHHGRQAFEDDRDRDQRLSALGYRILRVTWRQLTREPTRTAARIAAVLARS